MASGATVWDERLEALFGLTPGGFDGTYDAYVALLHPDDREAVADAVEAAIAAALHLPHRASRGLARTGRSIGSPGPAASRSTNGMR